MSAARWCDYGNHAFKEGADGAVTFAQTRNVRNQWGGTQPSTDTNVMEICPECAATLGLTDEYTAISPGERHDKVEKAVKAAK